MPHYDDRVTRLAKYLGGLADENFAAVEKRKRRTQLKPSATSSGVRRATLEQAVPGYAVRVPERGSAYKVITPVENGSLRTAFTAAFASPDTPVQQRLLARCKAIALPEDVLFVDIETTGLGQTPLFLIGVMTWEGDNLVVRQFLARDCHEEPAVIQLFADLAAGKSFLITFNGKSFDLPMIYQRAERLDVPCILHAHHFDLLHECRRVWQPQLPNCQLQTLEQQICNHPPRDETVSSEQIPAVYEAFLRNGNALQLAQVMHHNVQDLVTMAELLVKLPAME